MPVLHKYNDSYHKSGYYVKVNWSAPHPYPLQTPAITEQIYLELGFESNDDVPNELTSRLVNAGLHWTEENGPGDPEEQAVEDPITDASLSQLTQQQLDRVYELLDNAEAQIQDVDINYSAIDELKSELNKLESGNDSTKSSPNSASIPEQTVNILGELTEEDIDRDKAVEIRAEATSPEGLDHTVNQFVRNHLITPQGFEINEHGDPTFKFQTGPIWWKIADCRSKNLDFDWAVTIAPDTDRSFGIRVRSNELVRTVSDSSKLSTKQATDLITIIPCLLWTIDSLDDYQISPQWHSFLVEDDLPTSKCKELEDQTETALQAVKEKFDPSKGTVIDTPDSQFARIRGIERCIICAPVASLPNDAEIGTKVAFDVERWYGSQYATNITIVEEGPTWPNIGDLEKEIRSRLTREFEDGNFQDILKPINKYELSVDINNVLSDSQENVLEIRVDHFVDSGDHSGNFRADFFIAEGEGLDSVNVLTSLEMSWQTKGEIFQLLGDYLPVIATALNHNDIDPGSYYDSVSIEIESM